jgi:acetylornithine/succinyldiaminopimelate/putrescine aminotransferase
MGLISGFNESFIALLKIFLTMEMQKDFFIYQAQTTKFAAGFEVEKQKEAIFMVQTEKIFDFVAGVSANTLGHSHPKVVMQYQRTGR